MAQDPKSFTDAQAARAELYGTLELLSERLNYGKRFDEATERVEARVRRVQRDRPVAFALAVAGVATVVGVAAWAAVSAIVNKRR